MKECALTQSEPKRNDLTIQSIDMIFSNIEQLYTFNVKVILHQ